jgi:hypothetical protein
LARGPLAVFTTKICAAEGFSLRCFHSPLTGSPFNQSPSRIIVPFADINMPSPWRKAFDALVESYSGEELTKDREVEDHASEKG